MAVLLITGGAGFIGSHCAHIFLKAGYELIIVDSLINSSIESVKRVSLLNGNKLQFNDQIKFIQGDIRDIDLLKKIFKDAYAHKKIDGVIHLAGLKAVGESVQNPLMYWDVNVNGSRNLFQIMNEFNCFNLVFSSSATIYGYPKKIPISEEENISPINPYGNTKAAVEKILYDLYLSNKNSWKIINLRYFNPIGAHPSGLIGESPLGEPNNIFPLLCKVALKKLKKINIFGSDWSTKDGTCIRDYIHVMDLAEGHYSAIRYLIDAKPQYLSLNLGTGNGISVLSLINNFEKINGVDIPFTITNRREGDAAISIASADLALQVLNWKARRGIYEMCKDGWNWQVNNPDGFDQ